MGESQVSWRPTRAGSVTEGMKVESLCPIAHTFFEASGEVTRRGYGGAGGGCLRKEAMKPSFLELGRKSDLESVEGLASRTKRLSRMCSHFLRLTYSAPFGDILQPQAAPSEQVQRKWTRKYNHE